MINVVLGSKASIWNKSMHGFWLCTEAVFRDSSACSSPDSKIQASAGRPELRRSQSRAALLPVSSGGRLRRLWLGLGDRTTTLFGLLLFRWMSVSLLPVISGSCRVSCPPAAGARRWRRTVLLAEKSLGNIDVVLWRRDEHLAWQAAWDGCRTMRVFVNFRPLINSNKYNTVL